MKLRHALRVVGAGALTGALLLGTAPASSADEIRDRQWPLTAFKAESIWEKTTGKGVTVAVVDSGVDASFPDLTGQVLKGKNFIPGGGDAHKDLEGHGTGMASLIAGHGHGAGGGSGVKGLAPESKILPVRVPKEGDLTAPIRYAVDHGADVINISMGGGNDDESEEKAIAYAQAHDVLVVAGAGNSGVKEKNFPASYPGVVSVGAVDNRSTMWTGSSWGGTTLLAPGTEIVSGRSTSKSGYTVADGTSDAAAYVSAAASLVRAKYPNLSAGQVVNRLTETALVPKTETSKNPKLPDEKYGYGIVRPRLAVSQDIPPGPKQGPLAQASAGSASESEVSKGSGAENASKPGSSKNPFLSGPVLLGTGGVLALIVMAMAAVAIARRKRNRGGPGGGTSPKGPPVPPYQQSQSPAGQFGDSQRPQQ